ncbi:MAG: aminomethyl-transferring glycine dehydrogenase subunit GcvPA [Bdellovibrionales bacterium]
MRYLPLTDDDRRAMLQTIGVAEVEDLFCDVPAAARQNGPFAGLPSHLPEHEVERLIGAMAAKNLPASACPSFLGAGAYRHHVPAIVDHLIQRGEFLTSYTPYQPEVSQGTLQALFEFQTFVTMLTGMEVANASMYDGATACAEAVAMANRITQRKRVVVSGGLHPHWRETVATMAKMTGYETRLAQPLLPPQAEELAHEVDSLTSCIVVQNPDVFGQLRDYSALAEACHAQGALLIVAVTEAVSFGLISSPGTMGADIVVAEGQSLGNSLSFGGPYLGLFACREKHMRHMPGRVCGQTVDAEGKRGYVLTLSTREQHIRREKATSNICTNSGLCALAFTIHLSLLGEEGFKRLAALNHAKACQLAERLATIPGIRVLNDSFFNEFTVELPEPATEIVESMAMRRDNPLLAGVPLARFYPERRELERLLLVAVTELTTDKDMDALVEALRERIRSRERDAASPLSMPISCGH